jgi:molybdopterin molybdotransferase
VTVTGARAEVAPGARPGSLRVAALADAVAVIEPSWTEGAEAELIALP